jgi:hypothetical protein
VIVVIGSPQGRSSDGRVVAGGSAAAIAIALAGSGETVQLVGRIGDDPVADDVLADLSRQGVGHVAILRDAAHPTPLDDASADAAAQDAGGLPLDAEDVSLALRYLIDFAVLVVTSGMPAAVLAVATEAAGWSASSLIVVDPRATDDREPAGVGRHAAITVETAPGEARSTFVDRVVAAAAQEAQLRSGR